MLASRGERGSGRLRRTPGCLAAGRAPAAVEVRGRAAERPGLDAGRNPGVCAGVRAAEARGGGGGGGRSREQADGLTGCRRGRLCVVTLCATCRERELLAAAGRRQSRVRGSAACLRAAAASSASSAPPSLCLPVAAEELISMDSAERLREAGGIRPPASSFPRRGPPPTPWELRGCRPPLLSLTPLFALARRRAGYHPRRG